MQRIVVTLFILLLTSTLQGADLPRYYPSSFTLQAEYLYWSPCAEGFYVAIDRKTEDLTFSLDSGTFNGTSDINDKVKSLNFEGKSGVRLTFCIEPPGCHTWGLGIRWLYYNPCASKTLRSETPTLSPFSTLPMVGALATFSLIFQEGNLLVGAELRGTRVQGNWRGTLNLVDLPFGSLISPSERLCFKPHLDLRVVNWDQKLTIDTIGQLLGVDLTELTIDISDSFADVEAHERFRSCFTGVGPRIGGGVEWNLACGIGLYADIAFSALYGSHRTTNHYHAERFNSRIFELGNTTIDGLNEKRSSSKTCVRAASDVALGLFWEQCYCEETFIQWRLGWELLYLFNQSISSANTALGVPFLTPFGTKKYDTTTLMSHSDSDVTMQGLTLSGSVNF